MAADERVQRYAEAIGHAYEGACARPEHYVDEARAAIAVADVELARLATRILDIHAPIEAMNYRGGVPRPARVCTGCGTDDGNWQVWPCPTIRAIERTGK